MQLSDIVCDTDLFESCVREVTQELVYKGPQPVKTLASRIDGQSVHSDGHELVIAQLDTVENQMAYAKTFDIPITDTLQQPHLQCAAQYVAGFHAQPLELQAERSRKLSVLLKAADKLSAVNSAALRFASPLGLPIAKRFNVALLSLSIPNIYETIV